MQSSAIFLLTKAKAELLKKPTDDTKPLQLGMGDGGADGIRTRDPLLAKQVLSR